MLHCGQSPTEMPLGLQPIPFLRQCVYPPDAMCVGCQQLLATPFFWELSSANRSCLASGGLWPMTDSECYQKSALSARVDCGTMNIPVLSLGSDWDQAPDEITSLSTCFPSRLLLFYCFSQESPLKKKKKKNIGLRVLILEVPVVAHSWGCVLDPWPCSVG